MKLIVGLGNPGKKYERTRHNVGFMVLDRLHEAWGSYQPSAWELSKKFNAVIAGCTIRSEKVVLVKPMTFMNASGEAVQLIAHFYKIPPADIILVHDDKDLPLGTVKFQRNRGHAGHNGVRSVIEHIGTQDFARYRVGVADPKQTRGDTADFVLGKFRLLERKPVRDMIEKTVYALTQQADHGWNDQAL